MRTLTPPGGRYCAMRPGTGRKLLNASSAFTRTSIACPCMPMQAMAAERKLFSASCAWTCPVTHVALHARSFDTVANATRSLHGHVRLDLMALQANTAGLERGARSTTTAGAGVAHRQLDVVLREGQLVALCDTDLLADEVDPCHHLGHGVLHLQTLR
jgi:hypothetical protein